MKLLRLGRTDEDVQLNEEGQATFLRAFHHPHGFARGERRFRDDSRNRWWTFERLPGGRVRELTAFLQQAGFMPHASHDGIFGYVTQAAVRLFQEYVRTNHPPTSDMPPCWPDGMVGSDTRFHIERWRREGFGRARWCNGDEPTEDFQQWQSQSGHTAAHLRDHPDVRATASVPGSDTLPPEQWTFDPARPRLIGLRRENRPAANGKRESDDRFVLLLNGRTFGFRGSTDAASITGSEAHLTIGQHRYRFNWHNISTGRRERIYKAARPATNGVLVTRNGRLDPRPNPTINIHWNGLGHGNWSAGCQTISGADYTDDRGQTIDCTPYCARNDRERGTKRGPDGPRLTMGAYTVLSDLLLCYTPPHEDEKPTFRYTLMPQTPTQA